LTRGGDSDTYYYILYSSTILLGHTAVILWIFIINIAEAPVSGKWRDFPVK